MYTVIKRVTHDGGWNEYRIVLMSPSLNECKKKLQEVVDDAMLKFKQVGLNPQVMTMAVEEHAGWEVIVMDGRQYVPSCHVIIGMIESEE